MNAIAPALNQLNTIYKDTFTGYLDETYNFEKVKLVLFYILLLLVGVFIWLPYLKNLSNKIFRTKGMLNMIPMDIISKNENLKNLFISGDLLNAVK